MKKNVHKLYIKNQILQLHCKLLARRQQRHSWLDENGAMTVLAIWEFMNPKNPRELETIRLMGPFLEGMGYFPLFSLLFLFSFSSFFPFSFLFFPEIWIKTWPASPTKQLGHQPDFEDKTSRRLITRRKKGKFYKILSQNINKKPIHLCLKI